MAHQDPGSSHAALATALSNPDASVRLAAALRAGTTPDPATIPLLVTRCGMEPDFFVRDMLTWALTRHPHTDTLPLLLAELNSSLAPARSQALHTLSKIGDPGSWAAITPAHLHDPDPEVARTAWRTAAGLAPAAQRNSLARELVCELGRGDTDLKRSLGRALAMLGDTAIALLQSAAGHQRPEVRVHACATLRLIADPEGPFVLDPADARPLAPSSPHAMDRAQPSGQR
ncbi:HEAT repeat domain-containing protein [Achromobacter sp. SD115]|uniref:HEAT repeat domain-containing protein n=1 Tax=Achromobacter sp. SD115 TaxID=2782011 RepID=UPI001A973357|nr:HEAT repeat domain-containing protein [Achromobacter sp. SD115]MBO1016017.1 HEAT repeat domain-containing protein [Achromobacter sp. SD115]